MFNNDKMILHKVLNRLDYTGDRTDEVLHILDSAMTKLANDKKRAAMLTTFILVDVMETPIKTFHEDTGISTRTIYDQILRTKKHLAISLKAGSVIVPDTKEPCVQPIKFSELNDVDLPKGFQADLRLFDIKTVDRLKSFIVATGPSWFLRFRDLNHETAKMIETKLEAYTSAPNITDDIAIKVLQLIGNENAEDYRTYTVMRLILSGKSIVDPVNTDCFIHYAMGVDYEECNKDMSTETRAKVKLAISELKRFVKNNKNTKVLELGIDSVTPVDDYYLIMLAHRFKYPIVVYTYNPTADNTTLEDSKLSDSSINALKENGFHTTKEVHDFMQVKGEDWYKMLKSIRPFVRKEVEYWLR